MLPALVTLLVGFGAPMWATGSPPPKVTLSAADAAQTAAAAHALLDDRSHEAPPPLQSATATADEETPAGAAAADNANDMGLDVDRWVLHDVLSHGPGQTVPWHDSIAERTQATYTREADGWQQRVAARRAALALRGAPGARRDVNEVAVAFDIPLKNHPLVDLYIDYFTGRGRWFFARWLERSAALVPMMQDILAAHHLPKDLVYLAMIESGFSPHAQSLAAASGYWQFIPSTGALFGLEQSRFVDERRDFVRSTEAAGRFLRSLHNHFDGDWHLAWASYNAGEQRIRRAMAKTGAKTFWQLIEGPHGLAKETVHYVPKIIAAAIVAKDAARYGFAVPAPTRIAYDQVTVEGALDVRLLAKRMGVAIEPLRALNPSLLYDITPPQKKTRLRVPNGMAAHTQWALAGLPHEQRLNYLAYRVRKGDTLSGIAKRLHASQEQVRLFNRLRGSQLRMGQELLVPSALIGPTLAAAPASVLGRPKARKLSAPIARAALLGRKRPSGGGLEGRKSPKARHVVAEGDTLWSIAKRYKVAPAMLARRNARPSHLAIGEVVDIF